MGKQPNKGNQQNSKTTKPVVKAKQPKQAKTLAQEKEEFDKLVEMFNEALKVPTSFNRSKY